MELEAGIIRGDTYSPQKKGSVSANCGIRRVPFVEALLSTRVVLNGMRVEQSDASI